MKPNILKTLRENRFRMSRKEMADELGVSVSTISNLENGHRSFVTETFNKFVLYAKKRRVKLKLEDFFLDEIV